MNALSFARAACSGDHGSEIDGKRFRLLRAACADYVASERSEISDYRGSMEGSSFSSLKEHVGRQFLDCASCVSDTHGSSYRHPHPRHRAPPPGG